MNIRNYLKKILLKGEKEKLLNPLFDEIYKEITHPTMLTKGEIDNNRLKLLIDLLKLL